MDIDDIAVAQQQTDCTSRRKQYQRGNHRLNSQACNKKTGKMVGKSISNRLLWVRI